MQMEILGRGFQAWEHSTPRSSCLVLPTVAAVYADENERGKKRGAFVAVGG